MLKNIVIENRYYDSATLMLLTNQVKNELKLSTSDIAIMMATELNKRLMQESALLTDVGEKAHPGDMIVAIRSERSDEEILALITRFLQKRSNPSSATQEEITSVNDALHAYPESNFAVVSLPGIYAVRETRKLINAGKHVLLFSDNISIEDEVSLKELALSKDVLMMGPDCGTAIINGVGLGFANLVRPGRIGIVAASGTGLQEVATLISNAGGGISQAFGTGGRDIKDKVGGLMMLYAIDLLEKDDQTDVIVVVSKPPESGVLQKLIKRIAELSKPVVACFLGADRAVFEGTNIHPARTLSEAATCALSLIGKDVQALFQAELPEERRATCNPDGKIRAIYCGGTLAYETLLMLQSHGLTVYSNLAKGAYHLSHKDSSQEHSVLDMGEDEFTLGKPHPMIDPTARSERLRQEALDPQVSILMADVELGYGSHDQAADILADDVKAILAKRPDLTVIAIICGAQDDYQGYAQKKALLQSAGALVPFSNAQGVQYALKLLGK